MILYASKEHVNENGSRARRVFEIDWPEIGVFWQSRFNAEDPWHHTLYK